MRTSDSHCGGNISQAWFAAVFEGAGPKLPGRPPLAITVDQPGSGESYTNRHNDFTSLYIARQGRGQHIINGIAHSVSRGDVYVMGVGAEHYYSNCDALHLDTFHFQPSLFDDETLDALVDTPGFLTLFVPHRAAQDSESGGRWLHLSPSAYDETALLIADIKREWRNPAAISAVLTRLLFTQLMVKLARFNADSAPTGEGLATGAARERDVAEAVRTMDERYAEPLRIESLAAASFLSPGRFTQLFAQVMGRTPSDYLRHVRIERAKALLTGTDMPISEVGAAVGFVEAAYFSRVMRSATGLSPSEIRARAVAL